MQTGAGSGQNTVLMPDQVRHPHDMETGRCPDYGVRAAVAVHYLSTGAARAAAALAAGAAFAHALAGRTAVLPRVPPCWPGKFCRRGLTPLRAVLAGLNGPGLLAAGGHAGLDPGGRPGPGAHAHAGSGNPGDRGGQVQLRHRCPRGAGRARIPGAPVVRHRGRDARSRGGGPRPAHGRPAPAARRTAPRRHPRASRSARSHRPAARLTYADARNAA